MKKLLNLLSVLTISGTAVPTTIAASPYQKEEIINSDFNYQQINNLEKLNRNKRENSNKSSKLRVSHDINDYFKSLYDVISFLQDNEYIRLISPQLTGGYSSTNVFYVNADNNQPYFTIPFSLEDQTTIDLVFRSSDFYLQGFTHDRTYYHFSDSTINSISDQNSINLNFNSNYVGSNGLQANEQAPIRWTGIVDAFEQLANYAKNPKTVDSKTLKAAFVRVILATAESIRFRAVRENIISNYDSDTVTSNWGWYFNNFLRNWDRLSQNSLNYLNSVGTLIGFLNLCDINVFSKTLSDNFQRCSRNRGTREVKNLNNTQYCPILDKTFFYDNYNHNDLIITSYYSGNDLTNNLKIYDINLGNINPMDFNKITVVYDNYSDIYTNISFGNDKYSGTKITEFFEKNNFKDIILNKKIDYNNYDESDIYYKIMDINPNDLVANQRLGLSFYWENKNYHLQLIVRQIAQNHTFFFPQGGQMSIGIGKGIKLSF